MGPFLRIFLQKWAYFSKLSKNHVIWGSVRKVDPCLRIFWGKKRNPCLRISLVKKRPIRAAHPRLAKYVSTPPVPHPTPLFSFFLFFPPPSPPPQKKKLSFLFHLKNHHFKDVNLKFRLKRSNHLDVLYEAIL